MKKEDTFYNKNMLDHYFYDLFKRMDKQDEALDRVEVQTTTTNGRVNKLEWWQKAVIWGLGALWTLILLGLGIAIPILRDSAKENRIKSDEHIKSAVQEAVDKYVSDYDSIIIRNNK